MTATDAESPVGDTRKLNRTLTVFVTAALLAGAALAVGVNSGGTRAGVVEVLAVLVTTAIFGRCAYNGTLPRPFNASLGLMMMALLTGVAALSVGWSLVPNESLLDALRLVAYTSVLAAIALLAQIHQERAREIALGIGLAALIVVVYSLLSRCFPGLYPETDNVARLRLPFGYWNAVGTVAAIGLVISLWAGTRRSESRAIEIASYPAGGIFVCALMLSQSRAALVGLVLAVAAWFLLVPRRLRGAGWLAIVGLVSGAVVAWAYSRTALTTDFLSLAEREAIGWKLFVVLLAMSAVLTATGWIVRRRRHTHPLSQPQRRSAGKVLLIALAVSPFVVALALAVGTDRGLGTISDGAGDLFTTSAVAPANSPARLTQTNSLRGRYWSESWKIFKVHTWHGTGSDTFGVARLPYRPDLLSASHAHGMVPQVAADLGVMGLLALLGLTIAWLVAALKLAGASLRAPWRWLENADEVRLTSVALMTAALAFGIHSALDWVWFLPGVAFFGLVAGGWVLGSPAAHSQANAAGAVENPTSGGRAQVLRAAAIALVGIAVAYGVYQPVRAVHKVNAGLDVAQDDPKKAIALGKSAIDLDPTSAQAYMLIATAQSNDGKKRDAEATLVALVNRQPGNRETWLRLAQFRLSVLNDPDGAIDALGPIFYISHLDVQATALLTAARQAKADALLKKKAEAKRRQLERQLRELERLQQQGFVPGV